MKITGLNPKEYPILSELLDYLRNVDSTTFTNEKTRSLEK